MPFRPENDCGCEITVVMPVCANEETLTVPIGAVLSVKASLLAAVSGNESAKEIVNEVRKALGEDPVCEPFEEKPSIVPAKRYDTSL